MTGFKMQTVTSHWKNRSKRKQGSLLANFGSTFKKLDQNNNSLNDVCAKHTRPS